MKTLEELAAIRAKMLEQVSLRKDDCIDTRVVVGMATCGIAAGAAWGCTAGATGCAAIGTVGCICASCGYCPNICPTNAGCAAVAPCAVSGGVTATSVAGA